MSEPRMIVVPADAGELALRRGLANPIPLEEPAVNGTHHERKLQVKVVTLEQFTTTHEESAEPLIGQPDDSLLPADGLLLMYGDGGAGKTTLSIDALAHLASGTPWLGLPVPKPLRILLIENEGPRGPFRLRLANKISSWKGQPFAPNVSVLEEPWTRFTLTDPDYRKAIAHEITRTETDLVVVGPLASLGAKGTGTPDEINEFDGLIADMRSHTERRFALWIVHHENKSGDVSGAWERYPDSLVHIQAQGNGRTRIHWRKVRWSSNLHGTSTNLLWADGNSFELEVKPIRDIATEAIEWLRGQDWKTLVEISRKEPDGIGINKDTLRPILERLVDQGLLEYGVGVAIGRHPNSKCWRLSQDVKTGSDILSQYEPEPPNSGAEDTTGSLARPIRETVVSQSCTGTPGTSSPNPSQYSEIDAQDQELIDYYSRLDPGPGANE